jgi:hypothetical protein
MKLKEGFVLREVSGSVVVVPTGEDLDLNMMITLNGTGRFLWEHLEKGAEKEDLLKAMLGEYDVDEDTAKAHIDAFCAKLEKHGFLA